MSDASPLLALAKEFRALVASLPVPGYYKAFHTQPQHDGSPHIELVMGKFEYVVTERGSEFERVTGLSGDDVLYMLMESVTMHMATQYELKNRRAGIDGRSVWFPYQEELMRQLKPEWGARLSEYHAKVLEKHPFSS
jgi:hypothetical protein